jgi:hypothetical protein
MNGAARFVLDSAQVGVGIGSPDLHHFNIHAVDWVTTP